MEREYRNQNGEPKMRCQELQARSFAKVEDTTPAPVFFVDRDENELTFMCPKCKKKHYHGAGNVPETPYRFYGHRVAHCIDRTYFPNGYFLVGTEVDDGT